MRDVQVAYSAFFSLDLQSQTKIVGKVVQLNSSGEFSLLLNNPHLPYSMLGYNRTITCTNINVLLNIGPGARGGRKKRVKKQPSQHLTMIVASSAGITVRLSCF